MYKFYKQAGNAVTTNVVEAVARIILETEKEKMHEQCDKNF